jgi:hypothetical protein
VRKPVLKRIQKPNHARRQWRVRKPGLKLVQNPGPKPGHSQRNLGLKLGPKLVRNLGLKLGPKLVRNLGPKLGPKLGRKLGPKLVRNPGLQPGPKKLHARNRGLPLRHAQRQNQRKSRKTESK